MAGNGSGRTGSGRSAGGGVNLNPRRIGGSRSSTILRDRNTASFRRSASGPYGNGGRNERLMAAAGRMSRGMMSTYPGRGGKPYLNRKQSGDFYRPGTGDKFNGEAVRKGRRVTVAERNYRDNRFTGNVYRYRLTDRPGSRPVGAATVRRRIKR